MSCDRYYVWRKLNVPDKRRKTPLFNGEKYDRKTELPTLNQGALPRKRIRTVSFPVRQRVCCERMELNQHVNPARTSTQQVNWAI